MSRKDQSECLKCAAAELQLERARHRETDSRYRLWRAIATVSLTIDGAFIGALIAYAIFR